MHIEKLDPHAPRVRPSTPMTSRLGPFARLVRPASVWLGGEVVPATEQPSEVREAAALWLVKHCGELSADEAKSFRDWLRLPDHASEWQRVQRIWQAFSEQPADVLDRLRAEALGYRPGGTIAGALFGRLFGSLTRAVTPNAGTRTPS